MGGDDERAPLGAGGAVVTAQDVWEKLAEIPDPEIPVVSGIDLGVVRDVEVAGGRVRVEFTPTFMGCPALETMRARMEAAIAELGGEPEVEVVLDDSWSTDKITPEGREKLRTSGFAPPAPRSAGATALVQLDSTTLPLWRYVVTSANPAFASTSRSCGIETRFRDPRLTPRSRTTWRGTR